MLGKYEIPDTNITEYRINENLSILTEVLLIPTKYAFVTPSSFVYGCNEQKFPKKIAVIKTENFIISNEKLGDESEEITEEKLLSIYKDAVKVLENERIDPSDNVKNFVTSLFNNLAIRNYYIDPSRYNGIFGRDGNGIVVAHRYNEDDNICASSVMSFWLIKFRKELNNPIIDLVALSRVLNLCEKNILPYFTMEDINEAIELIDRVLNYGKIGFCSCLRFAERLDHSNVVGQTLSSYIHEYLENIPEEFDDDGFAYLDFIKETKEKIVDKYNATMTTAEAIAS